MALRFILVLLVLATLTQAETQIFVRAPARHGRQFSGSQANANAQSFNMGGFGGSSSYAQAQSSSMGGGLNGLGGYGGQYMPGYGGQYGRRR